MNIITHGTGTAEVVSENILISNADDALQLMADLSYQDFDRIIIHEHNIIPGFFDLKTGMPGMCSRNSPITGFGW